ncbi:MAG: hypothetical protein ACI9FB_000345 [Candidatus Azotimanducaceae bacterium]|jgi:hypothetical protein
MRILLLAGFLGLSVQPSIAAHTETAIDTSSQMLEVDHELASRPEHQVVDRDTPQKVYIESSGPRRNVSLDEENCSYNDEHEHIHCYESDEYQDDSVLSRSNRSSNRRVVYRTRDRDRGYRNTSGLAIGLAVGIPWLIHNAHHDRHYSRSHYRYRSGYHPNYQSNYGHRSHKRSHKRKHGGHH